MKLKEFEKVGKMLAKEHKIIIKEGEGWQANIKERDVYYRKEDIYNLPEDHILGMLLHEIAHIHYTTDAKHPKENEELVHYILNSLEDHSIEHIIGKDYPNAAEILEYTRGEVLDKLMNLLPTLDQLTQFQKTILYAGLRFEGRGFEVGIEEYEKVGIEVAKVMTQEKDFILNRKKTEDLVPLAIRISEMMIKKFGPPTERDRDIMRAGMGRELGQDGQDEIKKKGIEALKSGTGWKPGPAMAPNATYIDEIADQAIMVGKGLRTVLKRNNAMEFSGRFRSGKLKAKSLARVRILNDRRPFARRIVKSNQSYAFAVAADVSGSMFKGRGKGDPGSCALSSLLMVGEALKLAKVSRSMIVFGVRAMKINPMNKSLINWNDIANDKIIDKAGQGGTNIDLAMDACREELEKVRAERKIMIVLTDGGSDEHDMRESYKKATKAGIECLSISIGDTWGAQCLEKIFGKDKNTRLSGMAKDAKLIGDAFIKILKGSITLSNKNE